MKQRVGIAIFSIVVAGAGLSACAAGGSTGGASSYMSRCVETAKTEAERSECAWRNADRNASGN